MNKEELVKEVSKKAKVSQKAAADVILATLETIEKTTEKAAGSVSFLVGTTEFAIPMGNLINAEEEIAKMEAEITYYEGFIESVMKKLGNERFVANAKPEIVENERKKQADAKSKLETLRENISRLKKQS